MTGTYTDAISATLHVLAALAGIATIAAPILLAAIALRTPTRRLGWRIDAWRHRP